MSNTTDDAQRKALQDEVVSLIIGRINYHGDLDRDLGLTETRVTANKIIWEVEEYCKQNSPPQPAQAGSVDEILEAFGRYWLSMSESSVSLTKEQTKAALRDALLSKKERFYVGHYTDTEKQMVEAVPVDAINTLFNIGDQS